jgi:hypothetical protein
MLKLHFFILVSMDEEELTIVKEPGIKAENKIKPKVVEERQVIVHCSMPCMPGMGVRIWKSTFLVTEDGSKIPLLFWEGISLAPEWTPIFHDGMFQFTLIFGGFPSGCKVFSLKEIIPEPGGFEVHDIRRNKTDVYHVTI